MTSPDAPAPDWSALLADPAPVRSVLGVPAPPLNGYDLFSVHLDERDASVTLGFTAPGLPAAAAAEWAERGHTAVEFFLVLTGVDEVEADGWTHRPLDSITLADGSAVLSGHGTRISFTWTGAGADRPRGYLLGSL
ncbi:immunity 50 family protein [Kitasatospora sp. NBC_00240]|uniref:hypothetical protein n=1 Tax=Kitasatospora sp. NBC_00240 TaxID=2903567 RepID=UPI00225695F0|nr:hypothetical protein [Kitasatospora sp. NBC_00240]MCX5212299.1 immunity 50 family protein [Kitasatospora sp. NBC_00240]